MADSDAPIALWCKSNFSFLEGASHPEELVEEAHRLGMGAIALTDRDGVYGVVRAHMKAKALGIQLIVGATVTVEDASAIVLLALAHDRSWQIYVGVSVIGLGIGLAFSGMSALVVESVAADQTGVASGMNANIRTIGGAIGSGIGASLLTSGVTAAHPLPADAGYTHVFWMLAGASVLAALAAMMVPNAARAREAAGRAPITAASDVSEEVVA